MEKYVVFQYSQYYPRGGLDDISEDFESLEDAIIFCTKNPRDYNEIVDRDTWEIVYEKY